MDRIEVGTIWVSDFSGNTSVLNAIRWQDAGIAYGSITLCLPKLDQPWKATDSGPELIQEKGGTVCDLRWCIEFYYDTPFPVDKSRQIATLFDAS